MPRKLTTDEFIEKARNVHGGRYDYSLVEYVNNRTKVKISCSEHGIFLQAPHDHVNSKSNCPECSGNVKRDSKRFESDARAVHGNRYDYSLVEYVNNSSKVKIKCKAHGVFVQEAYTHLSGSMCPKCRLEINSFNRTLTTSEFTIKARQAHGDAYDYNKTEYKDSSHKVTITCLLHGDFDQVAVTHTSGHGCPKCGDESSATYRTFTTEEFINKSHKIHGNKYGYAKTRYENGRSKVIITCETHGDFIKTASDHLSGQGCGKCVKRNQDKSYIYLMYGDGKCKVGVSAVIPRRLRELKECTPFEFEMLGVWHAGDKTLSLTVERFIHDHFKDKNAKLTNFGGATEWFDMLPFEACDLLTAFLGAPVK
ncbi:hypothetical protein NVP1088O_01, partial [Vibrio phage 1.088.O._10N.261.46.A1]